MKNLFQSVILAVVSVFGFTANAQTKPTENSLLWKVSGNGLTKPSYLFGTIHMICENDFVMKEKVIKAFEKTSKLALEVNMSDSNEMAVFQKSAMSETLLTSKLSKEQQTDLNEILQKRVGIKIDQINNYTIMSVMSIVIAKSFGCGNLKFYEMEFMAKAKEKNTTIIGLETAQSQVNVLNNAYSDDEMIQYMKNYNEKESKELVTAYIKEDIKAIYQLFNDPKFMSLKTKALLLDNRNIDWSIKMPELMKKESVFFAVGAAHLSGESGVINLLKKAGYTVKPVMN
jgi:uncharacterized protein YbaP (TraB family)